MGNKAAGSSCRNNPFYPLFHPTPRPLSHSDGNWVWRTRIRVEEGPLRGYNLVVPYINALPWNP